MHLYGRKWVQGNATKKFILRGTREISVEFHPGEQACLQGVQKDPCFETQSKSRASETRKWTIAPVSFFKWPSVKQT